MPKQKRICRGRRVSYIHKRIKGAFVYIREDSGNKTVGNDNVLSFTVGSEGYVKILSAGSYYGYPLAEGDTVTVHRKQSKKSLPVKLKAGRIGGKKK